MNEIKIHVGDKVLIKNQSPTSSLSPKWLGPYEVIVVNDKVNVTMKKFRKTIKMHINNLKVFNDQQ